MTTEEMKKWIDNASYRQLLSCWRFASVGDPFFVGEIGDYYADVMSRKREKAGVDEHVRVSKSIGWKQEGEG